MTMKEMAKKNFDRGLWTVEMLSALVGKGKLASDDFEEITGQPCTYQAVTTD